MANEAELLTVNAAGDSWVDISPAAVSTGYQAQNTNIEADRVGIDATNVSVAGGVATLEVSGPVDVDGLPYKIASATSLTPATDGVWYIRLVPGAGNNLTPELTGDRGTWDAGKNAFYDGPGNRVLNWELRRNAGVVVARRMYSRGAVITDDGVTEGTFEVRSGYDYTGTIVAGPIAEGTVKARNSKILQYLNEPSILIPAYVYPTFDGGTGILNGLMGKILTAARDNPGSKVYAIMNPSNGPGAVADGNYTVAMRQLRAAGVVILGYVATGFQYNNDANTVPKSIAAIKADVDGWTTLYNTGEKLVDGMFFDEMGYLPVTATYETEFTEFWHTLKRYSNEQGYAPVVANPGVACPRWYFKDAYLADVIVIYENTSYPTEAALRDFEANRETENARRGALVYGSGVTWDAAAFAMMRKYVSMLYVNEGNANWDGISDRLDEQFGFVSNAFMETLNVSGNVSSGGDISSVNISISNLWPQTNPIQYGLNPGQTFIIPRGIWQPVAFNGRLAIERFGPNPSGSFTTWFDYANQVFNAETGSLSNTLRKPVNHLIISDGVRVRLHNAYENYFISGYIVKVASI